jgi:uncharacterized protein
MANPWILTYTGNKVDLLDPDPSDICILDIAHALGHINRFTGHTSFPYSVAEHSVMLSKLMPYNAMAALMHDVTEAYLGDVSSPLKSLLPAYEILERRMMDVIMEALGLVRLDLDAIKAMDHALTLAEAKALLPWYEVWGDPATDMQFECWSPAVATHQFLATYNTLRRRYDGLSRRM